MAYNVVYKKSVHRDLKKLPQAEACRILDRIEEELSMDPEAHPVLRGKFSGLRKFRVGDYRVIYVLVGDDILILRIGHRGMVYKGEI